jgi:hypothetical protein
MHVASPRTRTVYVGSPLHVAPPAMVELRRGTIRRQSSAASSPGPSPRNRGRSFAVQQTSSPSMDETNQADAAQTEEHRRRLLREHTVSCQLTLDELAAACRAWDNHVVSHDDNSDPMASRRAHVQSLESIFSIFAALDVRLYDSMRERLQLLFEGHLSGTANITDFIWLLRCAKAHHAECARSDPLFLGDAVLDAFVSFGGASDGTGAIDSRRILEVARQFQLSGSALQEELDATAFAPMRRTRRESLCSLSQRSNDSNLEATADEDDDTAGRRPLDLEQLRMAMAGEVEGDRSISRSSSTASTHRRNSGGKSALARKRSIRRASVFGSLRQPETQDSLDAALEGLRRKTLAARSVAGGAALQRSGAVREPDEDVVFAREHRVCSRALHLVERAATERRYLRDNQSAARFLVTGTESLSQLRRMPEVPVSAVMKDLQVALASSARAVDTFREKIHPIMKPRPPAPTRRRPAVVAPPSGEQSREFTTFPAPRFEATPTVELTLSNRTSPRKPPAGRPAPTPGRGADTQKVERSANAVQRVGGFKLQTAEDSIALWQRRDRDDADRLADLVRAPADDMLDEVSEDDDDAATTDGDATSDPPDPARTTAHPEFSDLVASPLLLAGSRDTPARSSKYTTLNGALVRVRVTAESAPAPVRSTDAYELGASSARRKSSVAVQSFLRRRSTANATDDSAADRLQPEDALAYRCLSSAPGAVLRNCGAAVQPVFEVISRGHQRHGASMHPAEDPRPPPPNRPSLVHVQGTDVREYDLHDDCFDDRLQSFYYQSPRPKRKQAPPPSQAPRQATIRNARDAMAELGFVVVPAAALL